MRIAVDGMGGDYAPGEIVKGCLESLERSSEVEIALVGQQHVLAQTLKQQTGKEPDAFVPRLSIYHAEQTVTMHDKPSIALRKKKDNSVTRSIQMLAQGNVDAVVSAGNTAAVVSIASHILGRLKGVKRPGVAAPLPARNGSCTIIDLGANIACKAQHLMQYGIMASAYAEQVLNVKRPRVGLINVGKEDTKGNSMIKDANKMLQKAGLNYVGYVEGHEIFLGGCDVAICEGFLGNTLLKSIEGFSQNIIHSLLDELREAGAGNESEKAAVLNSFKKRTDWSAYGGAPLLGVNGVCILSHGKSSSVAIANSIAVADQFARSKLNDLMLARLARKGLS